MSTIASLLQPRSVAPQSALVPGGDGAARIAWLWDLMLWLGSAITVAVIVLLLYALLRRRDPSFVPEADRPADPRGERANVETGGRGRSDRGLPASERTGARWMVAGGVVFPAIVLTVIFVLSLVTLRALYPQQGDRATVTIEVTGKQWWWEVRYVNDAQPALAAVTANELHIPVGQRVQVRLRADDVIHSFWVPGLQGKTDMIPGRTNVTWLHAEKPGIWRGQCAEFCGMQHAKMALVVVAEPAAEFARWLDGQRAPAVASLDSTASADRETFLRSGCTLCHAVRGTPAAARAGPDLTHVASRRTLAAGELPNTLGSLYGWIANPQALKPGSKMPAVPMTSDELHAIVRYVASLR